MDIANTIFLNLDQNEPPSNLSLSNYFVDENSGPGTPVGQLSSQDPDTSQSLTYMLIDGASARFKLVGTQIQVAAPNDACLLYGGDFCKLNFEKRPQHVVLVRVTDNGIPPQSLDSNLTIHLNDINDRPRDLRLSGYTVKENASIGTLIGRFSASDEDASQALSFSLVDDDGGRFSVDASGNLYKAKDTDYETSTRHVITASARDNGSVALEVSTGFAVAHWSTPYLPCEQFFFYHYNMWRKFGDRPIGWKFDSSTSSAVICARRWQQTTPESWQTPEE